MIGDVLAHYRLTATLGEGGMGVVYRATDTKLDRQVAIKVLPLSFAADAERLARFEREAKLLAQLHHPNVASIFGLEESNGIRALVMELVEGEDLSARIARGPLPLDEALAIAHQVAEALEAAHERGIVHRDLKPANVKVRADGAVKVLDFGLAKALDPVGASSAPSVLGNSPTLMNSPTLTSAGTQLGVILGTAAYMAPEQAKGFAVDKRADVWAFGVVLWEMLTGAALFSGDSASDTLAAVLRADIDLGRLPAGTPAELRRLLRRCLERNPKHRLHDVADARIALDDVIAGRDRTDSAWAAGGVGGARAPRARWLVPAAVGAALALAIGAYAFGRRAAPVAASATSAHAGPVAMRFQQVTDAPGVESQPSLSPDGKDVVFVRIVDGRSEIMIQRVGSRVSTSLTADSTVDDRQPMFSPDGERIAFRSERDGGGIFLMDTSGESLRRLTDFGFHPTWSPDGKEIAIGPGDFLFPTDRGGAERGLWTIDVAGGSKREISRNGDVMQPRWSPHGQRIAHWGLQKNGGQRDIFTIAADGSEKDTLGREVTNDPPLDWSPEWSPDGRFLYFASNRGGTMNLWRVAIDEATGKTLGAPEPVTTPSLWLGGLSFSHDGKRLAYGSLDWRTTLYRADLDAANARLAGPPTPVLQGTQPIRDHDVSSDGESIVWMRTTAQEDLFVARIDGSQTRRLTDDVYRDRGPSWSPDGQRIAFYSDRTGAYQVWLIRPDGSGLVQVTDVPNPVTFPIWSPDGKRIAYSAIPGGGQLIDVSGAFPVKPEPLPFVSADERFWPFSWSPDGKRLVGTIVRESGVIGRCAIYDLATKSFELLPVMVGRQWGYSHWLSDSRRVLVRDGRGIWLIDPGKGEPRRIVSVGGYSIGGNFSLGPGDRWLTWTETGTQGDVWIAELE